MAKRITKRKFINLTPSDIGKMKSPELRELLRGARNLFSQQESTFKRYEKTVWSPSLEKMQNYYEDRGKKAPSRMNMNQMRNELFHLQDFFTSETSTVPGARQVAIEQDKRIFGVNEKGKARFRPTVEQRTKLWSLFNEYKSLRPADVLENSNIVQQVVGQMIIDSAKNKNIDLDLSSATLHEIENRIYDMKSQYNWEMEEDDDGESVFSGTRPY